MIETNKRNVYIRNLILKQIDNEDFQYKEEVIDAIEILLNGNAYKYDFTNSNIESIKVNPKEVETTLSKFNEITGNRKSKGTYFTPQDVTNYITLNTILMAILDKNDVTYKDFKAIKKILSMDDLIIHSLLFDKTIFDPTCGSGEFLVNAAEIKIDILKSRYEVSDRTILDIAKTIFGNDINEESIDIAMYRLFTTLSRYIQNKDNYIKLAYIIKNNFTNYDFVNYKNQIKLKFDIIVGNPPYIEYRNYSGERNEKINFGNVYADVLYNSLKLVKTQGAFGYVLPLSYSSTNRMKKLREIVIEKYSTQFVLSFADRPDCLFTGVHQKLNIVIAKKGKEEHELYSSRYKIWRKEDRPDLLNGCEIIRVYNGSPSYIPKIGNSIEESIFRKVRTVTDDNLFDNQSVSGEKIYLNMRAAFWIKAFSFNPGSKEYKAFSYNKEYKNFIIAVLNSTLFWMFWTITSDGWHITNKELKEFLIPEKKIDYEKFDKLVKKLENKLEKTKRYIGTKQTEYEYKHRHCKDIIDEIDNALADLYELNDDELIYIKNFYLTYRTGDKNE